MRHLHTILCFLVCILSFITSVGQQWKFVEMKNLPTNRSENAFVKVGEKFYLLGGRNIRMVEVYDPSTNTWTTGAPSPIEMSHFQAVAHQGLIYVMGGLEGSWPYETPFSHIYIYDPLQDRWIIGPRIPRDRQRGAAGSVVYEGKIYLVCGIVNGHTSGWVPWLDAYDPATNTWRKLPDAPRSRDHFQAAVVDDKLVVTGGRKSGFEGKGFEATVAETDIFDFSTGQWTTLPSSANIPTQRAGCTAIVSGDEVIIIGGESGSQVKAHGEMEAFNVKSGIWRRLPNMQTGRHGTQALLSNGNLFIAAGCGNRGGSPELNSLERYSLEGAAPSDKDEAIKPGTLTLSADHFTFQNVHPYMTRSTSIELTNAEGNQGIPITFVMVTGSNDFSVVFPFELPYVVAPGQTISVQVHFQPSTNHPEEATLFVKTADRGKTKPYEVRLKGN